MANLTRNSSRADNVTVREVGRRKFEVDFTLDMPDGTFRFRRISPFQTKTQSREWGKQHRDAILARGRKLEAAPARVEPTRPREFAYWARRYLDESESPARRGGANKSATVRNKKIVILKHLLPVFGKRRITAIDDRMVEEYFHAKARKLALGTLRTHETQLLAIMRMAKRKGIEQERLLDLPEYRVPKDKDTSIPDTLSEKQTAKLLFAFGDAPPWQLAILTLMFRVGLRVGEAQALRWDDIDYEHGQIYVTKTVSDGQVSETTKGGRDRTVPLHWEVEAALARLDRDSEWLFPSPERRGVKPRSYRCVVSAIRPRWDECGFTGRGGATIRWHTHIGRHSLGRHWAERGWPMLGLQKLLGHVDMKTTQVYAHWSPSATSALLQRLGRS